MSGRDVKLACVRCGAEIAGDSPWTGCPVCAADRVTANVLPTGSPPTGVLHPQPGQPGIFAWRDLLPIAPDAEPVSLHEGNTPLLPTPSLVDGLPHLWVKDETRNPTWSYKDRLAAVAITDARHRGADTVALATTGNHGAATAAYAAAAGLRCVALTLTSVPDTMKVLMQSYGAHVVALDRPADRWALLRQAVHAWGWVPVSGFVDPPIGSNPFGVDGYKTIAYEVVQDLGRAPDAVILPAAYGDGLVGIHRGFVDLLDMGVIDRLPRMVAVDPFGAYAAAMAVGGKDPVRVEIPGPTTAFSVATPIATHQGLAALRDSGGTAVGPFDDATIMAAQRSVAGRTGLYLEASSCLTIAAAEQLRSRGTLAPDDVVVAIATSTGLKDVGSSAERLPDVPLVPPVLDALAEALAQR